MPPTASQLSNGRPHRGPRCRALALGATSPLDTYGANAVGGWAGLFVVVVVVGGGGVFTGFGLADVGQRMM